MKIKVLALLAALWLVLLSNAASSAMQEGVKLKASSKVIDIDVGHLVPCVTDWNNDGKKDLVVGQFSGGKIRLYLNHSTDSEPEFTDFTYLQAGGKEISLPAG